MTHDSLRQSVGLPPSYVLADAGYDSIRNRELVEAHNAIPIIKRNPRGRVYPKPTIDWYSLYAKRTSIERVFSRLKDFRRLNHLTLKGLSKATVHCLVSVLTLLAHALVSLLLGCPDTLRRSI